MSNGFQIDLEEITSRLKAHPRENYTFIYSIMKGATLANAAWTLGIFLQGRNPFLIPFLFWVVSFAAMLLTYNTTTVGTLLAGFRITFRDTILPFILAIFEFLLFSILQQETTIPYWYLVFAGFTLSTSLIIHSIIRKLKPDEYELPVRNLIKTYADGMKRDRKHSIILFLFSSVVGLLNLFFIPLYATWQQWYWVPSIVIGVILATGLYQQEAARRAIADFVVQQQRSHTPDA